MKKGIRIVIIGVFLFVEILNPISYAFEELFGENGKNPSIIVEREDLSSLESEKAQIIIEGKINPGGILDELPNSSALNEESIHGKISPLMASIIDITEPKTNSGSSETFTEIGTGSGESESGEGENPSTGDNIDLMTGEIVSELEGQGSGEFVSEMEGEFSGENKSKLNPEMENEEAISPLAMLAMSLGATPSSTEIEYCEIDEPGIKVTFIANPAAFIEGKFADGITEKTINYQLMTGGYYQGPEEIQIPNLSGNYMFEGWYTNVLLTPESRWTGLNASTTYTAITLYAKYLPFEEKTQTWDGVTFTIMDRNLGATDYVSGYSYGKDNSPVSVRGNYYQWGNNFGFPTEPTGVYANTLGGVLVKNYSDNQRGPGNYYFNGTFIKKSDRWDEEDNRNLWGGTGETRNIVNSDADKQGPCPVGYHVPSTYEWQVSSKLFQKWQATEDGMKYCNSIHATNVGSCMLAALGMPFAGYRDGSTSSVTDRFFSAHYWSSTVYNNMHAYRLDANASKLDPQYWDYRARAFSLRCFKNSSILTLTFDSNGGGEVESQTGFKRWNPRNNEPIPTRAHSVFSGWYSDENLTQEFTFSDTTYVSENKTLYAKWDCEEGYELSADGKSCKMNNSIVVTIEVNNPEYGSVSQNSISAFSGDTIELNENILTIGSQEVIATSSEDTSDYIYVLSGWNNTCGNTLTHDCTITVEFAQATGLVINYNLNGGYLVENHSTDTFAVHYEYSDGKYTTTQSWKTPSKSEGTCEGKNCMFDGWYLEESGTTRWTGYIDSSFNGKTVYAKWLPFEDLQLTFSGITFTIMDRNLGALSSGTGCNKNDTSTCGYHFQWGNNYGFKHNGSNVFPNGETTSGDPVIDRDSYVSTYYNGVFSSVKTWNSGSTINDNLWGGNNTFNSDEGRQGPCPEGYHVPDTLEWQAVGNIIDAQSDGNYFSDVLKLPFGGVHAYDNRFVSFGTLGAYWSSSPSPLNSQVGQARYVNFRESSIALSSSYYHSYALSVRCFKDTPDFTLSFDSNGGSEVPSVTGKWWNLKSAKPTDDPNKENNVFSGWYLDSDFNDKFEFSNTAYTTGNIQLYAKWDCAEGYILDESGQCVLNSHIEVTFIANPSTFSDGKFLDNTTSKVIAYELRTGGYFQGPEEIQIPNLSGYMFEGWYTDTSYSTESRRTGLTVNSPSEMRLYARYLPFEEKTQTWDGVTFTIMDRNLGATDYVSGYSYGADNSPVSVRGNYYQWGNNFGFPSEGTYPNTLGGVLVENYQGKPRGPGNYYFNGTFIKRPDGKDSRWDADENRNLWGGLSGSDADKQGPCPAGYHVPRKSEWSATYYLFQKWQDTAEGLDYCNSIDETNTGVQFCMLAALGMPFAGNRVYSTSLFKGQGTTARYWSSTAYTNGSNTRDAYSVSAESSNINIGNGLIRASAFSVRCFKDSDDLTLTFDSNGGSEVESQTGFKRWNPRSTKPVKPDRANSIFSGWYSDSGFVNEFEFSSNTYISEDKTLYAKWDCEEYYTGSVDGQSCEPIHDENNNGIADEEEEKITVTIEVNNSEYGTVSSGSILDVLSGTSIATSGNELKIGTQTVIATPTISTNQYSYSFKDWEIDCGNVVTGNCTITGNFARTINQYMVTFANYDGTVLQTGLVEYGNMPSYTKATPTKAADNTYTYTFKAWTPTISEVTGNSTYTATFDSHYIDYTIKFVDYDGRGLSTSGYHYGDTVTVPTDPSRTGYTFSKWTPSITTVAGNQIYTGMYTINQYTISYVLSGGANNASNPSQYTVEDQITFQTPIRDHSQFNGWTPASISKGTTGDKTIVANWSCNTGYHTNSDNTACVIDEYTVTVNAGNYGTVTSGSVKANYGTSISMSGNKLTIGTQIVVASPDTNDVQYTYTFSGWNNTCGTKLTGNCTITAEFKRTINKYTVQFVNDDNTVLQSGQVEYGVIPVYSGSTPTKTATAQYTYTYNSWDKALTGVTGDVTYKATYTSTTNKYTITWKNDKGEVVDTGSVEYGQIPSHEDITKESDNTYTYTFKSWTPAILEVTGNATYTATFDSHYIDYTIKFVDYDGREISTSGYHYGDTVTAPADPSRTGYTFSGWTPVVTTVSGNQTYIGTYTINQYTITFDSNGGTAVSPITQNYDTDISAPTNPTKTGYEFKGWNPSVPAKMPAENMTLTGTWEANEYTITFNSDGGSAVSPITGTYDFKLGTLPTTTKTGYTFSGWYNGEELYTSETVYKLTTGVELKAKWTANTNTNYTVQYYYQNIENNDYSLSGSVAKTGTADTLATAQTPAVEGFTFNSGYANNVLTGIINGNGNLVLKVYYSRNSHTLTYKVDNEVYGEVESYRYGKSIMLRSVPNKIGYVFSGWNNTVATMPDSNVEITGVFNTGSYDAVFKINGTVCGTSANVLFGDNITVPALCVAADGYELGDWNPSELVMNSEGKEFTTTSTPMIYSITYNLSGGTNNVSNPTSYTVESEDITLQNPTREHSQFKGWTPLNTIAHGSTGDKVFTAKWSCNTGYHANSDDTACVINTYTVNFVDWNGASLSQQTVNYGSSAVAPANPSRTGYTFRGWNPSDFTNITSNLTITGQYEINTYNLKINYNYSRGEEATGSYNTGVNYNTNYNVSSPSIQYYTANPIIVSGTMADTGIVVNVVYTPDNDKNNNGIADEEEDDRFTVSFTALGSGTLSGTTSYSDILSGLNFTQAGIEIPNPVANQYYEFSGWTPEEPIFSMIVTGDLTFTAEFKPIKDENGNGTADEEEFFNVTFDSKGGSAVIGQTVKYGERATEPGKPIKSGQTFTGWYEDESYNTIWDFATRTITQNQTLFAKWTDRSIGSITIKAEPAKTGYIEGEVVDMSGLVIEVTYDNGETGTVSYPTSGLTINPAGEIAKGTTGIEITYGGETVELPVEVTTKKMTGIEITRVPAKTSYIEGQELNLSGMEITVTYDNGKSEVIPYSGNESLFTTNPANGSKLGTGNNKVEISYTTGGITKTATQSITVSEKQITEITVKTEPTKTGYIEGEVVDMSGLVIEVTYDNGETGTVAYPTSGLIINPEGEITYGTTGIEITYGGKKVEYPVEVATKKLEKIEIANAPEKTSYIEGQELNLSGMEVKVTYDNGKSEVITSGYTANPAEGTKISKGATGFEISYTTGGITKTATQNITVSEKQITEITVKTEPTKTGYIEGEVVDMSGLVIEVTYDNGETGTVAYPTSGLTINPEGEITYGTTGIEITYEGKTVEYPVVVSEKKMTGIEITRVPAKTSYIEGQELNLSGMEITVTYDNGKNEVIPYSGNESLFTTNPANGSKLGTGNNKVEISYTTGGITSTGEVMLIVVNKVVTDIEITTVPEKTHYTEGETLDLSGLVIKVIYNDGDIRELPYSEYSELFTISPTEGAKVSNSDTYVIIRFEGQEVKQPIYVEKKTEPSVPTSNYSGGGRRISPSHNGHIGTDESVDDQSEQSQGNQYSEEMNDAYKFAYKHGITTMDTIEKADMDGYVLRSHLAKMLSQFAVNVMGKTPDLGKTGCEDFADIQGESEELKGYIKTACKLGLMGLESDGETVAKNFNPTSYVSRAEFGTTLSRLLYGETNNLLTENDRMQYERYEKHLLALKKEGIMTQITGEWITNKELRGYVMLMLMRSAK